MFRFALFILLFSYPLISAPKILYEKGAFADQEIHIEVVDLDPNQIVDIEVRRNGRDQIQWISSAKFQADENGIIRLASQAPLSGSYEGVDSMGLFWSMQMGNIIPDNTEAKLYDDSEQEEGGWFLLPSLRILDGNRELARMAIRRFIRKEDVEFTEVREDGLIGDLFIPSGDELFPVVIVLTGSNGGIPGLDASLLASHAMAAFALAYSGMEGLPENVKNVPLEYFETAFAWIRKHPRLNGKIFLHGTSRGAELALLLGGMFPEEIDRIVAVAPSSVVLSPDSWIYRGEPVLPAAPHVIDVNHDKHRKQSTRAHPRSIKIYRERGFYFDKERYDAARLPVEKIACPILLISGGDDQLSPCTLYAEQILERLDEYRSTIQRVHLNYPEAGHLITFPYFPRMNVYCDEDRWMNFGGTPLADELASRDSWKKTLEFLKAE